MKIIQTSRIFYLFKLLLIINLLISITPIIPLWDFENSAIDLLPNEDSVLEYTIYEETTYNFKINKTIKKGTDDSIEETNIIYKNNNKIKETEWEGLESIYNINNNIYVCPRGKYHIHKYIDEAFQEIKPNGFSYEGIWDLKCYHQLEEQYFFIFYLNNYNHFYYSKQNGMESSSFFTNDDATKMYNGMCDFKWTTSKDPSDNGNNNYLMADIVIKDDYINLQGTKVIVNGALNNRNEDVHRDDCGNKIDLINNLDSSKSFAYFSDTSDEFYFYSYNDTILKTGYYDGGNSVSYESISSIGDVIKNENSILNFFHDYTIKKINYVGYTKYLYYEIFNTEKEKTYYGFIDIKLNKILFNTDEIIKTFKPLKKTSSSSSNSMLVITNNSAYEICSIYDSDSNECIDSCVSSSSLIVNSRGKNYCGDECTTNYIMIPDRICIDECDENLFYKSGNQCGFCKDLNETHPFKLFNTTGCLSQKPEGAEYYKKQFLLLKCKENYTLLNGECIPREIEISTEAPTEAPTEEPTEAQTQGLTQKIEKLCGDGMGMLNLTKKNGINHQNYVCYPNDTYIKNFYFDSSDNFFKPCFETCLNCSKNGDKINHNCLSCEAGYMKKPYGPKKDFNCVSYCEYFYISIYNQYKCVERLPCPQEAKYLIKEKKECTDDCKKDDIYRLSFEGYCYESCPPNTYREGFICKVDTEEFSLNENIIELNYTSFAESVDSYVSIYANEFSYTDNHVTKFKSSEYEAIIYKNSDSINELSLDFPNFDFGNCYNKVKDYYNISENESLIVMVINKLDNNENNPITSYSFFHPNTSEKLKADEICKNETINVKENILSLMKNLSNYESLMNLISQGINIFNQYDNFYTDLCYDYNYSTEKDIALQDRIKIFYPNISLCDSGCNQTDLNLEKMTANCECGFNDISSSAKKDGKSSIKENVFVENLVGDTIDLIDSSNIDVFRCIKKASNSLTNCYGFYIFLCIIAINIVFTILYFVFDLKKIRVYIYETCRDFLQYSNEKININSPPLKQTKSKTNIIRTENKKTIHKKDKKTKTININNNRIKHLNIWIDVHKNNPNKEVNKKNPNLKIKGNNTSIGLLEPDIKYKSKHILNQRQRNTNFFEEYFPESLDEMEYDNALIKDDRKFFRAFFDILKDKQIILNTFLAKDPFKPRSIKIIIFCLNITLYFVVNALFINDSYISKIYNSEKKDNFFSFIIRSVNRVLYTTLVSIFIEYLVDFFFVDKRKLKGIFLREIKDKKKANVHTSLKQEIVMLANLIKTKYFSFIIVDYAILIICLYYILCFNSIYPKIQMEWIRSSIFIIILRQILSVMQCLLETSLRLLSYRLEMERLYKVSKLVN